MLVMKLHCLKPWCPMYVQEKSAVGSIDIYLTKGGSID